MYLSYVKYDTYSKSLGWPIYEGGSLSSDIDAIQNYVIYLNYKTDEEVLDVFETTNKLKLESVPPNFYYNHNPTQNDYRGAIIGGDIITYQNSDFVLKIAFVDIVTNELFLYDISSGDVSLFPSKGPVGGLVLSTRSFTSPNSDFVLTTLSGDVGKLVFIKIND